MTRSLKEPPEQLSPTHIRGGGIGGESKIAETDETPIDQQPSVPPPTAPLQPSKLSANIAAAFQQGAAKRAELRRILRLDVPTNPYNNGQTPLTDKYLRQCNDFYLCGVDGLDDTSEFTQEYYNKFHFPEELFSPIQYTFIKLIDDYETPYLDDKQIRNLPKLNSLDPETFVDWYTAMRFLKHWH
jgi:hypothetical protein